MRKLIGICVVTFLLYFAVSSLTSPYPNFDSDSYKIMGDLTLKGQSVYPDPAISRHPYLPLFLYFEAITQAVSSFLKIPQILIIKLILASFHLLSVYAVYLLSRKKLTTTFLYAVNPISLLIVTFHGQFDIIPLTLILFAIIMLRNKQFIKTILLLSLAVTIKTWPILFIVPFLKRIPKKFWLYIFIIPSVFLFLYSYFFHTSIFSVLRVLLVYQGVGGIWGFGKVLSLISTHRLFFLSYKVIFALGILFYSHKQKRTLIKEELLELFLLFFIFTPGFGLQWFLWLIPFLFLTKKPFIHLLISVITLCLLVAYSSWEPFSMVSPHAVNTVLFLVWPLFIIYFFLFFILLGKNVDIITSYETLNRHRRSSKRRKKHAF